MIVFSLLLRLFALFLPRPTGAPPSPSPSPSPRPLALTPAPAEEEHDHEPVYLTIGEDFRALVVVCSCGGSFAMRGPSSQVGELATSPARPSASAARAS